jgi:hypothetical protein
MTSVESQNAGFTMNIDFRRRVEKNTILKYPNALSPLFEAVMNSVDAIRETSRAGKIQIEIERNDAQSNMFDDGHSDIHPVKSFKIKDNGIGVTEEHFEAFGTADTAYKATQGGKGVGRFVWLKAFDHAEVRSVFVGSDGKRYRRTFNLCLTARGIEDHSIEPLTTNTQTGTEVRLCDYRAEYQKEVPKYGDAIGRRVIECFLQYFVLGLMPGIVIKDDASEDSTVYDLQQLFAEEVESSSRADVPFKIAGQQFTIAHFLVRPSFQNAHRLYFCSDKKMVVSKPLTGKIANLGGAIRTSDKSLMYAGYVSGPYMDQCSNGERTAFEISDEDSSFGPGWNSLFRETIAQASEFLDPYTEPIKKSKDERIRQFAQTKAPQYRQSLNTVKTSWIRFLRMWPTTNLIRNYIGSIKFMKLTSEIEARRFSIR